MPEEISQKPEKESEAKTTGSKDKIESSGEVISLSMDVVGRRNTIITQAQKQTQKQILPQQPLQRKNKGSKTSKGKTDSPR